MTSITSDCPQLDVNLHERVLTLRFNRPERKNALSLAMYAAAANVLHQADASGDVRVIIITGAGECFTSGNDLVDFMNEPEIHENHSVVRFMRALQHAAKPVIAAVRGPAIGIGTTMLLHCDLVYAADNARLQMPFVNLGLCPEYAASYLLPSMLGHVKASELLLLGETFTAAQALQWNMITGVVEDAELDDLVNAKAQRLAQKPPAAVRRTKALLKQTQLPAVDAAIAAEFIGFAEGLGSDECKEAVMAFFEKRTPDFSRFE
jgi:enoyl-CoA hydratase/carnithine racemase